ncbi:polysaccharide deacetylase family protein [Aquibacillus rhizosphaerae]|uniref:Polysaccharide deacetylase family protein n=1 Tax=Aquibacillus rhizosphaerae TaxID=3051431 RepID=A0ABT7L491_9BACI|nr:polysaccharide deacetylase family protein [Aquibacillus sp. LR5S19]MDL4840691.1 polysaccharide deacetylase family protein [Aquibacillus sp. LR5S19]
MKKWVTICTSIIILLIIFFPIERDALSATLAVESSRSPVMKNISEEFPLLQVLSFSTTIRKASDISQDNSSLPSEWGLDVRGVKNQLNTNDHVIALTFDACGSSSGSNYDQQLIDFLVENNIPATLFINERWIEENKEVFLYLASLDQFQIENHGTNHKPLSINGQSAYGIKGTLSSKEAIQEIISNYKTIYQLTGHQPKYFRSGTAHYDDSSVSLLNELGMEAVNFNINGDAGATLSANEVKHELLKSKAGTIAILHMNQPNSQTAEGIKMAIPNLLDQGFKFVKLDSYELK